MSKRPTWLSRQRIAIKNLFSKALIFYSPRTALRRVREIAEAPTRDFTASGFLKGTRAKHPLALSERQLRIKRTGLTPEAQAAGAERPAASYRSETTRIAAQHQRKTKLQKFLSRSAIADEQKSKATQLEYLETYNGNRYRATDHGRERYAENRERWLRGETLENSDYFNLRDYVYATNDPITRVIRTSPKTRPQMLAEAAE